MQVLKLQLQLSRKSQALYNLMQELSSSLQLPELATTQSSKEIVCLREIHIAPSSLTCLCLFQYISTPPYVYLVIARVCIFFYYSVTSASNSIFKHLNKHSSLFVQRSFSPEKKLRKARIP